MPFFFKSCVAVSGSAEEEVANDPAEESPFSPKTEEESVEEWILRIQKFLNDQHQTFQKEKSANTKQTKLLKAELKEKKEARQKLERKQEKLWEENDILEGKLGSLYGSFGKAFSLLQKLESNVLDAHYLDKMAAIKTELKGLQIKLISARKGLEQKVAHLRIANIQDVNVLRDELGKEISTLQRGMDILQEKLNNLTIGQAHEAKQKRCAVNHRISTAQEEASAFTQNFDREIADLKRKLGEVKVHLGNAKQSVQNDINDVKERVYARR